MQYILVFMLSMVLWACKSTDDSTSFSSAASDDPQVQLLTKPSSDKDKAVGAGIAVALAATLGALNNDSSACSKECEKELSKSISKRINNK